MMLHQDGSRHEWLAGQAPLDLIVTMLLARIRDIHRASRGTYGAPRSPKSITVHEIGATPAKVLPGMLEELFGRAPAMADRCGDFSADRGLDNGPQKARLWDK